MGISTDGGEGSLSAAVVRFGGFLKSRAFRVFPSHIQDALECLAQIPLESRDDFFSALRANMVSNDLEWRQFPDLFEAFWGSLLTQEDLEKVQKNGPPDSEKKGLQELVLPDAGAQRSTASKEAENSQWLEGIAYSPVSVLEKKDMARFEKAEVQTACLALKQMMEPFRVDRSRRSRKSRKPPDLDFPRVVRRSMASGGLPFRLFYKDKKKRLKRLVILADVSGSMDRYARFVMPFLLGLRGIGSRAEVFVFSTALTRITFMIRHLAMEQALDRISREVPGWSGGTRIGYSLHQFNQDYGQQLLNRRSVVVFLSDGWDLGGKELLRREMAFLSARVHSVVWLNPLAGDPDYQPLCHGMQIVLPYVNHFLPADSLQSLKRVGRLLARMVAHG